MRVNGFQTRYSSSPMMPPRMSTVLVVPTPRGCGLVELTLVIALAQRGQASASASTETFAGKLQVTLRENHRSTRPIRSAARLSLGLFERCSLPSTLEVGTVDVLTNATVIPASDFEFSFATPA